MKKNKLLYILTILITLFSFNMNANATNDAPRFLTCVYKKTEEEGANTKVALQQIEGQVKIYINKSNVAITQPGWQEIDILRHEDNNVDRDLNYKRLKSCPNSITIRKETLSSCNHADPLNPCTTEEKNIIVYYGGEMSGKQQLESTLLEHSNINEKPEGYDDNYGNDPGNPEAPSVPGTSGSGKVDTFTTGKTCAVAIEDCKKRNDGHCEGGTGHLATCYYGKYIENEGCHLVSVSFPTKDEILVKTIDPSYNTNIFYKEASYDFSPISDAVRENDGWCLRRIGVNRVKSTTQSHISETIINGYDYYFRISEAGYNLLDQTKLQSENPDKKVSFGNLNLLNYDSCESLFEDEASKNLLKMIKTIITIIKVAIPILLIGLGIADFAKAVFAGKEDDMKKAQAKFMKRVIIGVCIFLIPTLLQFILTIGNSIWGNISVDLCGILN